LGLSSISDYSSFSGILDFRLNIRFEGGALFGFGGKIEDY
jgi:hypothetical protein